MPIRQYVDKATFLNAALCQTRGWFTRNLRHATPPTDADLLRMEEGTEIGRRARLLFPNGVLVPQQRTEAAAGQTAQLMADRKVAAIFEATFCVDDYVAKADILLRAKRGWHLLEVKSSINPSQELVEDLAYTVMVAKKAGAKIVQASLLLLSGTYELGDPDGDLFIEHDRTVDVAGIVDQFEAEWDSVAKTALAKEKPAPQLMFACRSCDYYSSHCLGKDARDSIFELPRLSRSAFNRLVKQEVTTIPEIPASFKLTDLQERVRQAIVRGQPVIARKELAAFLNGVDWPTFYLDFETVKTSIPLYTGTTPHEQIVTQYSVHVCKKPGVVLDHREFLADPSHDCRRELAERLLEDLEDCGAIVVYSSFEKTVLGNLGKLFHDLKPDLDGCIDRLFDLEKAFRSWFYHPEFRGRTSIKVTLPALVNLSYDGLAIGDGDTAVAKYARMARAEITGRAAEKVRRALLEYCKRDTLAMVKLHERLLKMCR